MAATSVATVWQDLARTAPFRSPATWLLLGFAAALTFLYWPSFSWIGSEWSSANGVLSHGYLVAAITVYLIIRSLSAVDSAITMPFWWALPVIFGLSIAWLMGTVANVAAVHTAVLPLLFLFTVMAVFGLAAARILAFAVLYFYFAMPAVEHLQFIFQAITIHVVHFMIRLVDVPVYVEGNFVNLPFGTFEIIGGCSGLSFILSGLSLAALFGYLFYTTARQKWILLVATLIVAMLGNWIRVFSIVLIGNASKMQSPLVEDHFTLGWILFSVLMVPVYLLARRMETPEPDSDEVTAQTTGGSQASKDVHWPAVVAATAMLAVGPLWAWSVQSEAQTTDVVLKFPENVGGWETLANTTSEWQPRYPGATAEALQAYRSADATVFAYQNVYQSQEQNRELIYYGNRISGDWRVEGSSKVEIDLSPAGFQQVRQVVARGYGGPWVIWYGYRVLDQFVTSDVKAKIWQAIAVLRGKPEAGVSAYAIRCNNSCEEATKQLNKFLSAANEPFAAEFSVSGR